MKSSGGFRFALATLLKVRGLREEAARLALAQSLAQVAKSRQALAQTRDLLASRLADLTAPGRGPWPADAFLLRLRHLGWLRSALAAWQQRLAQEEAEVATRRETLAKLHQEHHLLKRLAEKAWGRYRLSLARSLEQETEALILTRWPVSKSRRRP